MTSERRRKVTARDLECHTTESETMHSDEEIQGAATRYDQPLPKKKSLLIAYVLAVPFGIVGAHRFYLGQTLVGIGYLMSYGVLFIGWLVDLFRLPAIVREAHKEQLAAHASTRKQVERGPNPITDDWDPLTHESDDLFVLYMKNAGFVGVMSGLPVIYYYWFGDLVLALTIPLLCLIVAFNGVLERLLGRQSLLWKIPGLRACAVQTHNEFLALKQFYRRWPPGPFLRTIGFAPALPINKRGIAEWKLFRAFLSFGVLFAVIEYILLTIEYLTLFRPDLSFLDFVDLKIQALLIIILIFGLAVVPLLRTLLYVEVSGKPDKAKTLVVVGVIATIIGIFTNSEPTTLEDFSRLELRLEKVEGLNVRVDGAMKAVLEEYSGPMPFSDPKYKKYKNGTWIATETSARLTRNLREKIRRTGSIPDDELDAFRVIALWQNAKMGIVGAPIVVGYIGRGTNIERIYHITRQNRKARSKALDDSFREAIDQSYEMLVEQARANGLDLGA